MQKKLIIILSIIVTLFALGSIGILKGEEDSLSGLTGMIPNNVKTFLKKTIFVHSVLKNKESIIKNQEKIIEFNNITIKQLDYKLNTYFNDLIKEKYFEKKNIKFEKIISEKNYINKNINLKLESYVSSYLFNGKHEGARATGYLDQYKDKIFLATGDGMFLYFDIKNINENLLVLKKIKSNIKNKIFTDIFNKDEDQYSTSIIGKSIKDLKIIKNKMYISFHNEVRKDCYNTSILKAEINFEYLIFEDFFIPNDCVNKKNKYGEFNWFHSGGRITEYKDDAIIYSMGEYKYRDLAQNADSIFGKIISINKDTKKWKLISMGHRNPQGLFYNFKKDYVISTEHGPNGGDEINFNLKPEKGNPKNFGWPISSYGYHYDNKFNQKTKAPLHKSHKKYGFQEPIKFYTPGIAISEIIKIPIDFGKNFENDFLIASMGKILDEGDLSIHHLKFNEDFSSILEENIIQIGERVRDIIFVPEINKFLCYLETSGSILMISNNQL